MTIKIIQPVKVFGALRQVGEIIDTLQVSNEQSLIGAGFAIGLGDTGTPIANNDSVQLATSVRKLGARKNQHSTRFRHQRKGPVVRSGTNNRGQFQVIELPQKLIDTCHGLSFVLRNGKSDGTVTYKASFSVTDDINSVLSADTTLMTLAGSNDIVVPSEVGLLHGQVMVDDVYGVRLKKYLTMNTWAPDDTSHCVMPATFGDFSAGPTGTLLTKRITAGFQNVDFVTTPALLTDPTYSDIFSAIDPVFLCDWPLHRAAVFGNSGINGLGVYNGFGWMEDAFWLSCEDGGSFLTFINMSEPDMTTAEWRDVFAAWIPTNTDFDEIMFQLSCGDDQSDEDYEAALDSGDFSAVSSRLKGIALYVIQECADRGIASRIIINRYRDSTPAEYEFLKELTAWARQLEADGKCFTHDMPAIFNDEDAPIATYRYPGEFPDLVHASDEPQVRQARAHLAKVRAGR